MRIVDANVDGDRRCCRRSGVRDARDRARASPTIVDRRPRATATRRCCATRARSIGSTAPIEIARDEMMAARAHGAGAGPRGHSHGRPQHPRGREAAGAARLARPRRRRASRVEQRVVPLDRVGCYVPGGRYPLPSSLLMTAIPARAAGVREIIAVCPRPEPVVMAAALEAGVVAPVPARRRARDCGAGLRHRDGSARGQDRRARATASSPRRRRSSPPTAASTSTPARPRSSSSPRADRRLDCRRPDRAGRARSRCARGADHAEPRARRRRSRARSSGRCPPTGPARESLQRARRHHRHAIGRTRRSSWPTPPRPNTSSSTTSGWRRR